MYKKLGAFVEKRKALSVLTSIPKTTLLNIISEKNFVTLGALYYFTKVFYLDYLVAGKGRMLVK